MGKDGKENFYKIRVIVESFVRNALVLSKDYPSVSEFDRQWYERVSKDTGLSVEEAKRIHHPVYWYLISSNNRESPLEYVQATKHGEKDRICFRGSLNEEDNLIKKLTDVILVRHGVCLESKFNNLRQQV